MLPPCRSTGHSDQHVPLPYWKPRPWTSALVVTWAIDLNTDTSYSRIMALGGSPGKDLTMASHIFAYSSSPSSLYFHFPHNVPTPWPHFLFHLSITHCFTVVMPKAGMGVFLLAIPGHCGQGRYWAVFLPATWASLWGGHLGQSVINS